MAKKILSGVFWVLGIWLTIVSVRRGGWDLLVPGAAVAAAAAFGIDLLLHRHLVAWDRGLAQTFVHVLSAVVLAAFCLLWMWRLMFATSG